MHALLVVSHVGLVKFLRQSSAVCFVSVVALGVCCSGCPSPVTCLLGGSSLRKVRGCPDCRRTRRVSGAIAPLELALAVRCGPLVVTPAKSMQNLIITLQNHLSPNETPHTQTFVSLCICIQPKAMKPKTPWIYQQKSPIIS